MIKRKISIIGLGYVGLPLAIEFGKKRRVIGYDISESRVNELKNGIDNTHQSTLTQRRGQWNLAILKCPVHTGNY
mgnify:CR=1 FL=1